MEAVKGDVPDVVVAQVQGLDPAQAPGGKVLRGEERKEPWLPDGYARFLDHLCLALGATGLWQNFLGLRQVGGLGSAIQGKEGIKIYHLATLPSGA